ncbi:MAG: hypothetical protein AB7K24_30885 [Gemmataceae bacterium]
MVHSFQAAGVSLPGKGNWAKALPDSYLAFSPREQELDLFLTEGRFYRKALQAMVSTFYQETGPPGARLTGALRAADRKVSADLAEREDADELDWSLLGIGNIAHVEFGKLTCAWVGSGRIYVVREGCLLWQNKPHTVAQALIEAGHDPQSVRSFIHVLMQGFGNAINPASPRSWRSVCSSPAIKSSSVRRLWDSCLRARQSLR